MSNQSVRRAVFQFLDPQQRESPVDRLGTYLLGALILANVLAVILESMAGIRARFGVAFDRFETFSVWVFTLEYLARLWTCVEQAAFRSPVTGRVKTALSPMALIDLAVLLPTYLPGSYFVDLRFARIIRVIRMLRVLKLARYSTTLRTFGQVFRAKRVDIALITLVLLVLVVVASSLMYFIEHGAQPESFSSIPASMWWTVMTLTTVGYGDIYPITPFGKLLGAMIALIGIGLFALPAGVLAAGFAEQLTRQRKGKVIRTCPYCSKELT